MDAEFIPADTRTTARLINSDRNADLLLRPTQFLAQCTDSAANDGRWIRTITRHVASFVTKFIPVVTLFVTLNRTENDA